LKVFAHFTENCHFKPLFLQSYCVLSMSALVESVFTQSGLILRANRVKMIDNNDKLLAVL